MTRIGLIGKDNSAFFVVSAINMAQKNDSYHVVPDLRSLLIAVSHTSLKCPTTMPLFYVVKILK